MQDPKSEIRNVVRAITEPISSQDLLAGVDKYFTPDAILVHPMLNTPKQAGRSGVKAAYKMLRVLTINNKIDFHAVGFDEPTTEKDGQELMTGLLDLTENLQLRILPIPGSLNPVWHIRFLVRIDLRKSKSDGKWYITKQEDNIPTDIGSQGISHVASTVSNGIKFVLGIGTMVSAAAFTQLGIMG